jgi:hypothetical protein
MGTEGASMIVGAQSDKEIIPPDALKTVKSAKVLGKHVIPELTVKLLKVSGKIGKQLIGLLAQINR